MEIDKIKCTSLELAKELKENGYPQEGLWWWKHDITGVRKGQKDGSVPYVPHSESKELVDEWHGPFMKDWTAEYMTERFMYIAPTVAELGEVLPETIDEYSLYMEKMGNSYVMSYSCPREGFLKDLFVDQTYQARFPAKTEADARAKMWLYLKKNNLLEDK